MGGIRLTAAPTAAGGARVAIACPVCGGNRHRVRFEPRVHVDDPALLYGVDGGVRNAQRIVVCLDCRMVFENPRLPAQRILSGYAAAAGAEHHSQFELRVETFSGALSRLARWLPAADAAVLDIGAAGGAFLEAATGFGYRVTGLEPSERLVEQGRARGFDMRLGTLEQHALTPGSFDLVTFWDVLEHLTDPRGSLEHARRLLRPGGALLLNLPDFGTWSARLLGRHFWWYSSPHLLCFDEHSVRELLCRTGYRLEHAARHWQILQLGHLIRMAGHLGVPLATAVGSKLAAALARLPIRYSASQTTFIARSIETASRSA